MGSIRFGIQWLGVVGAWASPQQGPEPDIRYHCPVCCKSWSRYRRFSQGRTHKYRAGPQHRCLTSLTTHAGPLFITIL